MKTHFIRFAHKWKRGVFLIPPLVTLIGTYILLTFGIYSVLPLTAILVGFSYGGLFCLLPTITCDLFGVKTFGRNWGSIQIANALGVLFYGQLSGFMYQQHAPEGSLVCVGVECYRGTFIMTTGGATIALFFAIILTWRMPAVKPDVQHVLNVTVTDFSYLSLFTGDALTSVSVHRQIPTENFFSIF